ncbi:E3 ubiquitin-protein ligase RNF181-like, partial [Diaphorina citri]|uniref:E3 ubiquitin-protein ligase RNF181-like n=1 Tax=Diaphorina citri TaxID=121845 RepID=A0A1S3DG66_DIACI
MSQEDDGFNTSGFIIYHGAMGETIIIDRFLNISRRYNDALSLDSELSPPRAPFSTRRFGQIPSIAFPADEAPDAQCVICLAPFQPGEEVKELLCHHKFHSECLEPWLRERQHCPLCRNAGS